MTDDEYDAVYSLLREGLNSIPFNQRVHSGPWKELLAHINLKHTNPGKCENCSHKCHGYAGVGEKVHGAVRKGEKFLDNAMVMLALVRKFMVTVIVVTVKIVAVIYVSLNMVEGFLT